MNLPDQNTQYKEREYWDTRFQEEDSYDWFVTYDAFKDLIRNFIQPHHRILILGCGNSTLSEDMYKDGFHYITNIDYSPVVIAAMKDKYKQYPEMKWLEMDIRDLKFEKSCFDIVLEKGTLDALLVDEKDPWWPSIENQNTLHIIFTQISKVLKEKGHFLSVTFAQPHFRIPVMAKTAYDWSVKTQVFGEYFHFYFYSTTKGNTMTQENIRCSVEFEERLKKGIVNKDTDIMRYEDDENFLMHAFKDCDTI